MKFRRTTAVIGLALSSALLLGACTSPEEEPGGTTEPTTGTAGPTDTAAPPTESGPAGCLQDVGITATQDGEVKYTAGPDQIYRQTAGYIPRRPPARLAPDVRAHDQFGRPAVGSA